MKYTYKFANYEKTHIRRYNEDGEFDYLIAAKDNEPLYVKLIKSKIPIGDYVPVPIPPEPETTEEKINKLLSDYGLTREEMVAALEIKKGKR